MPARLLADPGDAGAMILETGRASGGVIRLSCGLDGAFRFTPDESAGGQLLALTGRWSGPDRLELEHQYPGRGDSTCMTFRIEFEGPDLTVRFADNEYASGTIHGEIERITD